MSEEATRVGSEIVTAQPDVSDGSTTQPEKIITDLGEYIGITRPIKVSLQSPGIRTRSSKEKAIDADIINMSETLSEVSMGIFINGSYEDSYLEERNNGILDLSSADITYEDPLDATAGVYSLSISDGTIQTTGSGTGLEVTVRVRESEGVIFINFKEGDVIIENSGEGFSVGEVLSVNTTDIGGSNPEGVILFTLTESSIDSSIEYYAGITVSAKEGVALYGPRIVIDTSSLPSEDPMDIGALWVENGFLKISEGGVLFDREILDGVMPANP